MGSSARRGSVTTNLARHHDLALRRRDRQAQHDQPDQLAGVDSFLHPDARTVRLGCAGEAFDLYACVQALFIIKLCQQLQQDQQARFFPVEWP